MTERSNTLERLAPKIEAAAKAAKTRQTWPAPGLVNTDIRCLMKPRWVMERRKFSREFKFEAVNLVREQGVSAGRAARDLDVHENVLRKWMKEFGADPTHTGAWPEEEMDIRASQVLIKSLRVEHCI